MNNQENNNRNNYQPQKKAKKVNALISLLVALGIVGGSATFAITRNNKDKKDVEEPTTKTSDSTTVSDLYLSEDFDITNAEEVRKRAQAIYDISDKDISVNEIMNIIYLVNGKYDSLSLKATSEDGKYSELQNLFIKFYDLLGQNLTDDTDNIYAIQGKDFEFKLVDDTEIFAYMFLAKNTKAKEISIRLSDEVNKQLKCVDNGNLNSFKDNAQRFYAIYEEIINSSELTEGEKLALINDVKAKMVLYPGCFTDEQVAAIEKSRSTINNKIGTDAAIKVGAEYDANKGNKATTTPIGEKYNASDAKKAESLAGNGKNTEPKLEKKGGQKVATSQKVIKQGTTKVEIETFVVDVKTGTYTEVEKGGKVVSEKYVDEDAKKAQELEDKTTTTTTTTKYVDSDNSKTQGGFKIETGGKQVK